MSSESDRIHEPSPIRLMQAKEEGRVARSAELSRALTICLILSGIFIFAGTFQQIVGDHLRNSLGNIGVNMREAAFDSGDVLDVLFPILFFIGAITVLGILVWHIQSPLSPRFQKAAPDFGRLAIGNSLARIFSLDNLIKTLLLFVGFVAIGCIAFFLIRGRSLEISTLASQDLQSGIRRFGSFLRNFFVGTGAVILALGLVDYIRERFKLASQLRMTDQERRDEARNSEMNPEVRRRLFQ